MFSIVAGCGREIVYATDERNYVDEKSQIAKLSGTRTTLGINFLPCETKSLIC